MVSVERIKQFTNIPSEAEWEIKDCLPSPGWPNQGNVDLDNLQVPTIITCEVELNAACKQSRIL